MSHQSPRDDELAALRARVAVLEGENTNLRATLENASLAAEIGRADLTDEQQESCVLPSTVVYEQQPRAERHPGGRGATAGRELRHPGGREATAAEGRPRGGSEQQTKGRATQLRERGVRMEKGADVPSMCGPALAARPGEVPTR